MVNEIRGDRRVLFGWAMYDWANSAYATAIASALLPGYFGKVVVPEEGFEIAGRMFTEFSLWGFMNAAAALFVFATAPVLGAIADFASAKKKFLLTFCYFGVVTSALLYFCQAGDVWLTMGLFVLSHIGFVGANVFYDAFLPQIAPEGKQDWVSSKGFAYGYIGGGIQFALALLLIAAHQRLGIKEELAARLGMLSATIWWGGFALVTAFFLKEAPAKATTLPAPYRRYPLHLGYVILGLSRVRATTRKALRLKYLVLFLLAFMIYNDGIQTVIKMAAIYGEHELRLPLTAIMITLLIVQFVAFAGAYLFAWASERVGTRFTIILSLIGWCMVVTLAYFIHSAAEFFVLGAVVGVFLAGSQALSRSFYGSMIPEHASAEFFAFYSVFSKFSAIWGPLLMAILDAWTGSARNAIVSLVVFFVVGIILLAFVDQKKAREASTAMSL